MGISACFVRVVVVLIVLLVSDIEQTSGMVGRRLLGVGAGSGGGSGGRELISDRASFRSAMPPTRGRFGGSANATSVGVGVSAGAGSDGGSGGRELISVRASFPSAMPPTRGRFGGSANTTSVGIGVSAGGSFGGSDNATSIGVGVSVGEGFDANAGVSFGAAITRN